MAVQLAVRFQWPGNRDLLEASTLWELHEERLRRKFPASVVLKVEDDFRCEQKEQILLREEELPDFRAREQQLESREQMLARLSKKTRVLARNRKGAPVFIDKVAPQSASTQQFCFGARQEPMSMRRKRWHFTRYARN